MTSAIFYFQVHQPFRLRHYRFFDIGHHDHYFNDESNATIMRRVAQKCYLPMNRVIAELIDRHEGHFRCAYSITSTALAQMEMWAPEALESFVALARTGCVEILGETSHHSLASLYEKEEFRAQVQAHSADILRIFGCRPRVFRNTELVLNNTVAKWAEELGFQAILGEGADHLLAWRSPHQVYRPEGTQKIKALLRSYRLSDDIAFRFSNRAWAHWPLSADRFANWLHELGESERFVGLYMDYETFGEHQWEDTGIFEFMRHLPQAVLRHPRFSFKTPSQAAAGIDPIARIDIPHSTSWADAERDMTAWLGNDMQRAATKALYELAPIARAAAELGRADILQNWRRLSTSDHVYYMCTKFDQDGDVHKYFSPHDSPHEAFIAFMNAIDDLGRRAKAVVGDGWKQSA
jgi:alpha-amylase